MTYSPLWDRIFGSLTWASLALVVVLAFVVVLFRVAAPKSLRTNGGVLVALCSALSLVWFLVVILVNPTCWGFGPTIQLTDLRIDGRSVVLLDYRNQTGGEDADPIPQYRVHELDVRDGRPRYRVLVGSGAHLVGVSPTEIVVRRDAGEYVYVDRRRGEVVTRLDRDDVSVVVPGLSNLGPLEWLRSDDASIVVSALDGTTRTISVLDRALVASVPTKPEPEAELRVSNDGHEVRSGHATRLRLLAKEGEPRRLHPNPSGGAMRDEVYLDGTFVAVTHDASIAVVLHYATTERKEPRLTGLSIATGAPVWSVDEAIARPVSPEWEALVRTALAPDGVLLAVAVDARVLLLDATTGRIRWVRDLGTTDRHAR